MLYIVSMKIREIDNRLEMIAAEKRQLQRERREALRQTKVNWQTNDIAEQVKSYEDFSKQCYLVGLDCYLSGECTNEIISRAVGYSYTSLDEAMAGVWGDLPNVKTDTDLERIFREHFFLWGVFRGLSIKTTRSIKQPEGGNHG